VRLTADLVRRFERHIAESVESLIAHSLQVPGNPEGYALFRDGPIRAMLSTNPHAGWATQTYGLTQRPADAVGPVIEFFNAHRVPACVRIVPDGFTAAHADALSAQGLRHVAFHTILWSPLPLPVPPATPVDIREVSTLSEMDAHIDIELGAYGVPPAIIDRLRPLRRTWLGSSGRRLYLAYVDGQPAAQAMLYWRDEIGYLESAGTLTALRGRGLQHALIQRRISDATALGCRLIIGGADFESQSLLNQMACGLSVAYTAARWRQRPDAMDSVSRSSP
jgi:hypothetical protein